MVMAIILDYNYTREGANLSTNALMSFCDSEPKNNWIRLNSCCLFVVTLVKLEHILNPYARILYII